MTVARIGTSNSDARLQKGDVHLQADPDRTASLALGAICMLEPRLTSQLSNTTIMVEGDRCPTLLCFSHLRWDFVYQRPQHLLTRAAINHRVIFFEEPIYRAVATPTLELTNRKTVTVAVPMLPFGLDEDQSIRAQKNLVDELLEDVDQDDLLTWYYSPSALTFSHHLSPSLCIYDNMDELSAFMGASPQLVELEREIFERADIIFSGGRALYEAKRERHPSIYLYPSSIDFDHFAIARQIKAEPEAQIDIPRPRLGFFGVIDERMDLNLVSELADARPDWQLVMLGPVVKIDAASLPQRPNIHWLGQRSYDELPRFLASWDLGLMPFALNEATRFISPTKTPEYLAAGLRVVSTPILDVVRTYGETALVEIANDTATFVEKISSLLGQPKGDWQQRADKLLSKTSWDATWKEMAVLIHDVRHRKSNSKIQIAPAVMEIQGV